MTARPAFGGIEAGGTKWVCGLTDERGDLVATDVIPTTTPDETLGRAVRFFAGHETIRAIGVGSFGPLDLDPASPTHGSITTTPKPDWSDTDLLSPLRQAVGVPIALDTDVNAAALGEWRHVAGAGLHSLCYITVGTGIGAGAVVGGRLLHGSGHLEFGHLRIPHDTARDPFPGSCPHHGDCLEGLASGEALRHRWGRPAEDLDDPAVWHLEAEYLAHAIANAAYALAPQRVIVGGGVAQHPALLPRLRERLARDALRQQAVVTW
ncbi:ROK family protein [Jiangella rhizosphaerae]|uniref:fructokinase n=1 Tax=Jiangella rhizosphaerae TaxID=2293569 RepID=A0A418KM26_9ACTN|nr:ROK family protein [Jiangella rhizosphaerae]RIQ19010.1 ROK family protein [Jiangella rhizosphaerae]